MIFVDRRIGSNDLPHYLSHFRIPSTLTTLEYGDCCWLGHGPSGIQPIGVELKKIDDLLSSLTTGRLIAHQIPGLIRDYPVAYLVIEGIWRAGPEGILEVPHGRGWECAGRGERNWMYKDIEAWLLTIETLAGIRLRRTRGREETVEWIRAAYGWWQKEWNDHKGLRGTYNPAIPGSGAFLNPTRKKTPEDICADMAVGLPDIGEKRARAVAQHFHTAKEMCNSSVQRWTEIDGIGTTIASRVVEVITGEHQRSVDR